jgi:hypothetical protein
MYLNNLMELGGSLGNVKKKKKIRKIDTKTQ